MYSSPTTIIWHTFTKASWELWSPGRLVKPQCRDQDCGGTFWEVRLTAKCLACPPMVLATEMETSPYLCGLPQPHLALGLTPVPHTKDLWGVMPTACWAVETECGMVMIFSGSSTVTYEQYFQTCKVPSNWIFLILTVPLLRYCEGRAGWYMGMGRMVLSEPH